MSTFEWPIEGLSNLGDGLTTNSVKDYEWIVIAGGILAFAMAWGIGANDVANAFATSVGAGSLSLRWAVVIAAIFEFLGAFLMGSHVTDTVRKKIINTEIFDPSNPKGAFNGPEVLMTGFLVALISATSWLIIATYYGLPVSTSHSIIGSLIGVGIAYRSADAVVWLSKGSGLARLKGVVGVIASWIISPLLSAIFAVLIFLVVRSTVLRRKNPVRNGFIFLPFFYAMAVAVVLFFIIYKGSPRFKLGDRFSAGEAVGISLGGGAAVAILAWYLVIPRAKRHIDRWEEREMQKLKNPEEVVTQPDKVNSALGKVGINLDVDQELSDDIVRMHDNVEKFDPKAEQLFTWLQIFTAAFDAFAHGANDVANAVGPFASIYSLYRSNGQISVPDSSKFEEDGNFTNVPADVSIPSASFKKGDKIPDGLAYCGEVGDDTYYRCTGDELEIGDEGLAVPRFPYLTGPAPDAEAQTFALFDESGAYVGSTTCHTKCNPGQAAKYGSNKQDIESWILALGGLGIVLGLAMWGYRIIIAIGVKLTKLTPSRGFSIEVGAAITVIIASRAGLPVSTTHCQVGATMGVGFVELKGGTVNWKQFFFIFLGWVFTVVFTGVTAGVIFAILIHTPAEFSATQPERPVQCPGQRMFVYDNANSEFRGLGCSGF